MSKFKLGEEVRLVSGTRNIVNNLGDGNIYVVEDIKSDGIKLKGLFPYYHYSLFETVETFKGNIMDKFKVGDKVVRVSETYGKAIKGGIYEVSGVSDKGCLGHYGINLKGHDGVSGKFAYEASCFELYIDDVLSPLEAAEALMNKDKLQVFDSDNNKWYGFHNELRNITLEDLRHLKLRRKPKTVVINGVEVVAPAQKDDIEQYFYAVNFSENIVHTIDKVYIDRGFDYYWAKKEDAQKALDAMLIPFNKLNKGDK